MSRALLIIWRKPTGKIQIHTFPAQILARQASSSFVRTTAKQAEDIESYRKGDIVLKTKLKRRVSLLVAMLLFRGWHLMHHGQQQ